ncbi:unnamed protein product [Protopolystoma xenopodis]|uniref:Noggin n=1 Tax=Protopolystoma xenopodis TaxID=117903 RepID=A0A3S4ZR38_9PLAT|nr:unnamed protein product [Protopolystoma xenopodis]
MDSLPVHRLFSVQLRLCHRSFLLFLAFVCLPLPPDGLASPSDSRNAVSTLPFPSQLSPGNRIGHSGESDVSGLGVSRAHQTNGPRALLPAQSSESTGPGEPSHLPASAFGGLGLALGSQSRISLGVLSKAQTSSLASLSPPSGPSSSSLSSSSSSSSSSSLSGASSSSSFSAQARASSSTGLGSSASRPGLADSTVDAMSRSSDPGEEVWPPSRRSQDYAKVNVNILGQPIDVSIVNHLQPDVSSGKARKLRKILAGSLDRDWMSEEPPRVLRQRGTGAASSALSLAERDAKLVLEARGLNITLQLSEAQTSLFRNWLVELATCEMDFVWEDLGPLFWPRWIRRGVCLNRQDRSCSWPPGMQCRPSGSRGLQLLHWRCENAAQAQSRKRAATQRLRKRTDFTGLHSSSPAGLTAGETGRSVGPLVGQTWAGGNNVFRSSFYDLTPAGHDDAIQLKLLTPHSSAGRRIASATSSAGSGGLVRSSPRGWMSPGQTGRQAESRAQMFPDNSSHPGAAGLIWWQDAAGYPYTWQQDSGETRTPNLSRATGATVAAYQHPQYQRLRHRDSSPSLGLGLYSAPGNGVDETGLGLSGLHDEIDGHVEEDGLTRRRLPREERRRRRTRRLIKQLSLKANGYHCYWQVQKYLISDKCTCSCS